MQELQSSYMYTYMYLQESVAAPTFFLMLSFHSNQGHALVSQCQCEVAWTSFPSMENKQNTYIVVNHSFHFVDRATGVHTQHIESYWNRVKRKFKTMKVVHLHQLPSYLDEFMWRERYGTSVSMAFANIISDIAVQYPV